MWMSLESIARASTSGGRPHLLSIWELTAFTAVVLVSLAGAFIHQELVVKSEKERLGDPLSVAYMENLLRTDPDNLGVRLRLAENEIYLGKIAGVPDLLMPVLHSRDQNWRLKAQLVWYKYLTKQYELGDEDDAVLMKRRRAMLARLAARRFPLSETEYLASEASRLHEHKIAVRLYRQIIDAPEASAGWCAKMAAQALGNRDYQIAAFLYFIARHKADTVDGQRKYFIAGIRALMAASLFGEAMRAADLHLGNLKDDPETLNFLVKAARAANDPERAARYVRLLLRVSSLERSYRWWQRPGTGFVATADAAPLPPEAGKHAMGPYDPKKYELAYKVFLESHNLGDAFAVAEKAVRSSPRDATWHRKLATVAEWVNKPEIALREWLWLMRHERRRKEADAARLQVLRIAPQLDAYDAALAAWKDLAARRRLTDTQWHTVASLFEKAGRPGEGIKYLEAQYGKKHNPVMLEMAAMLSRRRGDDRRAQNLYLRLLKVHGFRSTWVQNAANLYLEHGEYRKAYALLRKNARHADGKDVAYQRMLADLAWHLQKDTEATKGYQGLAAGGNLTKSDFSRLLDLLGNTRSREAAHLAELAYRKYGDRAMLLRALGLYAARHDLVAQKRLFAKAEADHNPGIMGDPRFILARAQYLQASGDFQAARADYRRAVTLAHDDPQITRDVLWSLVEAHDAPDLRDVILRIHARGAQRTPAYWGALAAAYDVLGRPQRAVFYYSRELRGHRNDFLWLLNYADALDRNRQAAQAWRVRRHAWARLRNKLGKKPISVPLSPDMLAAAQLEILNQPGDPSLSLVRSVLRQDRLVRRDAVRDPKFSELVLGWTLSTEQTFAAKAWLWQRYGRDLARPAWADATIASQGQDTAALGRLLATQPDAIPANARHDAAIAVNRPGYAQTIAFQALEADPNDEQAYANFTQDALDAAGHAGFDFRRENLGELRQSVQHFTLDAPLSDTVHLGLELGHKSQSFNAELPLTPFPSTERLTGISLENHSSHGVTQVHLRRINEFAGFNEFQVSHKASPRPNLTLKISGEVNARADESNELMVFGMRNAVSATMGYDFPHGAFLSVEPRYARYYTQRGAGLGYGGVLSWELGQHVSTRYPDLRVSLIGINEAFFVAQNAQMPLPRNQSFVGACFGFEGEEQKHYSRLWHPYFDACGTHNSVSGRGYIGEVGLAGPVVGRDRLNLSFFQQQGGTRLPSGLQSTLRCTYQYLF